LSAPITDNMHDGSGPSGILVTRSQPAAGPNVGHTAEAAPSNMIAIVASSCTVASVANLTKCIDASPVALWNEQLRQLVVFIGSHAGMVQAIEVLSATVLWSTTLPDRVEASCALSSCHQFLFVGCHDGNLYCCSVANGQLVTSYPTGGIIKAAPRFHPNTGQLWVASYNRLIHCLKLTITSTTQSADAQYSPTQSKHEDLQLACVGQCATVSFVFADPVFVDVGPGVQGTLVADLKGHLTLMQLSNGLPRSLQVVYQALLPSSVFATPAVATGYLRDDTVVIAASIQGHLVLVDLASGRSVLSAAIKLPGPVFSSPIAVYCPQHPTPSMSAELGPHLPLGSLIVVVGCRDDRVYRITAPLRYRNSPVPWR
ncbi:hypothetical protein H4R35_006456, partial [Dimargaris xerosporica]